MKPSSDEGAIRAAIRAHADVYRAPPDLRDEILRKIEVSDASRGTSADRPRERAPRRGVFWVRARFGAATHWGNWLRYTGTFATGVLVTVLGVAWTNSNHGEQDALVALAGDHARALVTDSTIEVASANTHTVKPWLSAKLGYSPEVFDLADSDFVLVGGRRGFLGREPVAVMVYAYKEHKIDVYALPADDATRMPREAHLIDGFNTVGWRVSGIQYLAMSDAAASRVEEFARRLEARQRAG